MKKIAMVLVILMMVTGMAFAADAAPKLPTADAAVVLMAEITDKTDFKLSSSPIETVDAFEDGESVDGTTYTVTEASIVDGFHVFSQTLYYNIMSNNTKVAYKVSPKPTPLKNDATDNEYTVTATIAEGTDTVTFDELDVKNVPIVLGVNFPVNAPAGSYSSTVTFIITAN